MPRRITWTLAAAAVCALTLSLSGQTATTAAPQVSARARQLHERAIVIDTHDDVTQRMLFEKNFDIGQRHDDGSIDIPRMREGGMDGLFFSIWVSSDVTGPPAAKKALDLIDAVREGVRQHPNDLLLATTAADVRRAVAEHKIAALMGVEGGHMIDNDLRLLRDYAALGVRYLTLTHFKNTDWADSATDRPAHNGLTPFGRDVVHELNRLGMMVDISHTSDKTFYDAIATSRAPIIASHSSCRAITNSPRNMTDDMLRALAQNGGVIQINYESSYINDAYRTAKRDAKTTAELDEVKKKCGDDEACSGPASSRVIQAAMTDGRLPKATYQDIVEHIDHAVKVAGVDHVGLGSDFDGATMPLGMEDASKLPNVTEGLLKKGYTDADIEKILGGNILRVMERVEAVAKELNAK